MASGRLICPRCGSNNFDTQAACWQCGSPLSAGGGGAVAAPASPALAPQRAHSAGSVGMAPPASVAAPAPAAPLGGAARRVSSVDPAVAIWTGVLSGLLLPYFMLPIGLAFMMLDDRRRLEVGRATVIASIVGSLIHFLFTAMALMPVYQMFSRVIAPILGGGQPGAARSAPAPNWGEEAPPLNLPGLSPAVPPR